MLPRVCRRSIALPINPSHLTPNLFQSPQCRLSPKIHSSNSKLHSIRSMTTNTATQQPNQQQQQQRTADVIPPAPTVQNNTFDSSVLAIGNTSLIRLRELSEATQCNIYAKAEYENPGGSVKDRAALGIIRDAEARGILVPHKPNQYIIEGTAGNTGIGLTCVANARGYKTIIVIADTQSSEKKQLLRLMGAQLLEVPAVPFKNPENYVHVARRLAERLKSEREAKGIRGGVLYADQWDNMANRQAHVDTTGPEIWRQTDGKIDAFSMAMGTGGTLTGISQYMRSQNDATGSKVKIALTDPQGAGLYRYYTEGALRSEGSSISEGIGQNRITGNMANFKPDLCFEISDAEALPICFDLMHNEGLCVGSSTAINLAGAKRVAQHLGPGHTIVTILCDSGLRYASKLFNPQFLRSRSLPVPHWLDDAKQENKTEQEYLQKLLALSIKE